jgi:hypothetical protein
MYANRAEAERALWNMASDGRTDCHHDPRFYALVLLATFASLRWGEATAMRSRPERAHRRARAAYIAYIERSTGELLLGPPKSGAGRRIVGLPEVIVPALREHLAAFAEDDPGTLVFPVPRAARCGGATSTRCQPGRTPSSRSACRAGTSTTCATLEPVRGSQRRQAPGPDDGMGHGSERAAMICQH